MGLPNNLGKLSNMITSTGSAVGIGTTNPTSILNVASTQNLSVFRSTTTTNYAEVQVENTTNYLQMGVEGATGNRMGGTIAYNAYLGSYANYGMTFHTNNLNRMTISASGNVGIGTSSPGAILDVVTTGSVNATFNSTATEGGYVRFQRSGTNFGFIGQSYHIVSGGSVGDMAVAATANLVFSSGASLTERMRITSSGNVGIGTSSPQRTFDARGAVNLSTTAPSVASTSGAYADLHLRTWSGATSSPARISVVDNWMDYVATFTDGHRFRNYSSDGVLRDLMILTGAGNIGFGLGNPSRPIVAYYSVAGSVMEVWNYRNNGSGDFAFVTVLGSNDANTNNYHYIASTGGADRFYVYGNGNVVNTNGSYGTLSDSTLKENIVDATAKLDDLLQLKVRNFNLIDDENKTKQIGFIAQEFEEVFPAMIDTDGKTGMKTIKTSVLVPMLVKAIQELNAKVTALENKS